MISQVWKYLARPLLFRLPAESTHHFTMGALQALSRIPGATPLIRSSFTYRHPSLAQTCFGLHFRNPVCLAAGFDKNGKWISALSALGFGAIEIGSVTGQPQPGNPPPRLFRLPLDSALINRMGFNNEGAAAVAERLANSPIARFGLPVGINLGKTKVVPLEQAVADYLASFRALYPWGDYFVVNVSSPNTPGLRLLQDRQPLTEILTALQSANREFGLSRKSLEKPILVKISPDLSDEQIGELAELALDLNIAGILATNTTLSRAGLRTPADRITQIGAGGLSGKPLLPRSLQVVRLLFQRLESRIPVIGVGGILSGADAWRMIGHGASLLQVYTGFIYGGPSTAATLNRFLANQLKKNQLTSVREAIGRDLP